IYGDVVDMAQWVRFLLKRGAWGDSRLISDAQIATMKPGSVIVDLAVEQGGNVALSQAGEAVDAGGVIILGFANVPGRLAADASSLYARNVLNFVSAFWNKDARALAIDWNDDIIKGVCLSREGRLVHQAFGGAPVAAAEAAPSPAIDGGDSGGGAGAAAPA
ncbi:MAG: hypothetical protein ABL957_16505, partial [Parvularculaceae bacterium]